MPPQEKNTKGFSILELLVVLALVAIISGAAYPNFSEWNKERAVRSDVDKIAALIKNTYTQTERGALAYVQIYFNKTDDGLFVEGRGLTMSTLATKINKVKLITASNDHKHFKKINIVRPKSKTSTEPILKL